MPDDYHAGVLPPQTLGEHIAVWGLVAVVWLVRQARRLRP